MKEAFLQIVNMSISASWLVIAVLLLRLVLKKAPKWANVLLWGFVAVRLICPVSFESALSLIPSAEPIPEQVIANLVVDVPAEIPGFEASIQDPADAPVRDETGDETGDQTNVDFAEPEKQGIPVVTVLTALWAVGVGAMLVYTAVSYLLLRRRVATAVRLENNIYQSENVDSPFVLGIVKAKIYLPFRMDSRDLAHVIAHEQAHIRRKDHWWKPFGFVLLAIHWFNPLMWVGYILLCRDIELACDEKVIREMDNETKADYTEALVACSVNRRRIAACPLAFGEVGVKERVKTVMNYKKPAFWIVIAAVALCIVVAVCFLTNPKDNAPQVGNPQMLELPGVQWFVTPDELKEALNITEEQIVDEITDYDDDHDTYQLLVKNLTLFDKDVTYGEFEFWRIPGHDFAFGHAIVLFAEDTDMEALKERVSDIYGPGVDEYAFYSYVAGNKFERMLNSKVVETLEYLAKYESQRDQLEGNPYQEALDDPEHMVHYWTTERGTSVIPAQAVEYFKYVKDMPWHEGEPLQDDDVLMEWMDQFPWVTISMGNRNAAAIQHDSKTDKATPYSYYTNNYMEFSALNLLRYVFPVDYEYYEEAARNYSINAELLEFPGLKWGMTPEEVKAALEISDDALAEEMHGDEIWITLDGAAYFGAESEEVILRFLRYNNKSALWTVQVTYAPGTDMVAVRDELIEIYGPGTDYGFTNYEIIDGTVKSYVEWNDREPMDGSIVIGETIEANAKNPNPPEKINHCWASTVKGSSVIPFDVIEKRIEMFGDDVGTYADRVTALEYLDKRVPIVIHCRDGYTSQKGLEYRPYVTFNARYMQFCKSAYDADNQSTSIPEVDDLSVLNVPGLKWGMTPEEVKAALGVADEQIIGEGASGNRWRLRVQNITLFGEITMGEFLFVSFSDNTPYTLSDVDLYYPDETDMDAIKEALTNTYGAPKDGTGFTRYRIRQGEVEEDTSDGIDLGYYKGASRTISYWESAAKQIDVLPADVQDKMATTGMVDVSGIGSGLDTADPATREIVQDYLQKESAVLLYCTDSDKMGKYDAPYSRNRVSFSATNYISMIQYHRK